MGKRRPRRKAGRRVYYARFSHTQAIKALPKEQFLKEQSARARFVSPANLAARERRENKLREGVIKTLGMNRNTDNKPRELALDRCEALLRLDEMSQYIVLVNNGVEVLLLLSNSSGKWWFAHRYLAGNHLKRSVEYGSREQAWLYHEADRRTHRKIQWVEYV